MGTGMLRNGVRYRSLGVNEHLDMTLDVPAVTHSIAVLLEVAAKVGVTDPMLERFEQMLEYCWNSFESVGDISIDIADFLIIAHTRHDENATYQMMVVLVPTGIIVTSMISKHDFDNKSIVMYGQDDWQDFLGRMKDFPANPRRSIRSIYGSYR